MNKTYKHKTLGWIAKQGEEKNNKGEYLYCVSQGMTHCGRTQYIKQVGGYKYSEKELIALGFLEAVQVDRIDECVVDICAYQRGRPGDEPDYVTMRKIIEQHLPKEKKFTREDLKIRVTKKCVCKKNEGYIEWFLKEHNLLLPDDTDE